MSKSTETSKWTDRQWAAYRLLKASQEAYEAKAQKARKMFDNAPKGGWTDADRVQ